MDGACGGGATMMAILLLAALVGAADTVAVSFVVQATVPDGLPVRVVGNIEALGRWEASASLELAPDGPGRWSGRITVVRGEPFVFNVIRGDWSGHALEPAGSLLPDIWCVAQDTAISVMVAGWDDVRPGRTVRGEVVSLGKIGSTRLPEARDVWVVLPPSYATDDSTRYPVLYVHDGCDVVDPGRSPTGVEWRLDEIADSLSSVGRMPEIITVAVASTQHRIYEYADTTLGEAYARFIVGELKPLIDRRFRTRADAASTATMGASLGGLIAFLTAWWHPDTVGHAACLSPLFIWGDGRVVSTIAGEPKGMPRVYLSAGEGGFDDLVRPVIEAVRDSLSSRGWREGRDLVCARSRARGPADIDPDDLARALVFLFGRDAAEERRLQPQR